MLIIMTFDHLDGPIKNVTFQPLGFVSAAAGFVYLSGFVYGFVYSRKYLETDFRTIQLKSARRAGVIYFYHLLVLLTVVIPLLFNVHYSVELRAFIEHPGRSLLLFITLLLQPNNMDILPMYMIFILLAPYILRALKNGRWKLVFLISGGLWFLNQFPVFQYNNYDGDGKWVDFGYFNIFCWQFLFFVGLFFGFAKATGKYSLPVTKGIITFTTLGLLVCTALTYFPDNNVLVRICLFFSERSTLGMIRLINFAFIAYLIYAFTLKSTLSIRFKWLSLLGRHSLQVFAYSVCLIYFILPAKLKFNNLGIWEEIMIDIALVVTLTIPAILHQVAIRNLKTVRSLGL